MKAWHFVSHKLRDGRPIPEDGEWLEHEGKLVMCESGLHASVEIDDALQYAPGNILCRVEVAGEIVKQDDKLVASKRKIMWRIDAELVLRAFARWCALQVIHLWDAPDVVVQYLTMGDESIRDAAWTAAWAAADAAVDAAGAAARDAAWAAAKTAARTAAWTAAWAAVWGAAAAAAGDASRGAQRKQLLAMIRQARKGQTEWVFEKPADVLEQPEEEQS